MEPTLFDVGRAQLPPRVLAFASGVNEAREIRGFSLVRIPVGFSAGHVREDAIRRSAAKAGCYWSTPSGPASKGGTHAEGVLRASLRARGRVSSALPMKKAGMTHAQVLEFVAEVRPAHVHLLGLGYQRATAK